jgi:glycosyltransferase involved in cell wall biosynthesis
VAPIEAMASGLPVVGTDASGVSDIFLDGEASGGVIVRREDGRALAEGLRQVLENDDWRRDLGRARRRVEAAFGPSSVGVQIHEFLVSRMAKTAPSHNPLV